MMWGRFADKGKAATEVAMMTKIKMMSAIVFALAMTALPVMARMSGHISMPSAQNSGAGIPGLPGDQDGAAVQPESALGFGSARRPHNSLVREQDAANIRGLPGTEAGPSVKTPPVSS